MMNPTVTVTKKYEMLFSDVEMGTVEFGFMPRSAGLCDMAFREEDEDAAYREFLKKRGHKARVIEGIIYVEVQVPVSP